MAQKSAVINVMEAAARKASPEVNNPEVGARLAAITPDMVERQLPFTERQKLQQAQRDGARYQQSVGQLQERARELREARKEITSLARRLRRFPVRR